MKSTLTALAALVLTIGVAQAADFPIRDVEKACQEFFTTTEYPQYNCIVHSQAAYNNIKRNWSLINDDEQISCIKLADVLGKHIYYLILESCVGTKIHDAYVLGRYKPTFQY